MKAQQQRSGGQRQKLSVIVTHLAGHWDELAAVWLILREGHRKFFWAAGTQPKVVFVANEEDAMRSYAGRDDVAFVGLGGGKFDEHRPEGRIEGKCATDLVAEHLGVAQFADLKIILSEVRRSDTQSGQQLFEMGQLVKVLMQYGAGNETERHSLALQITCDVLDAHRAKGREFHLECKKQFEASGRLVEIGDKRVAFVTSDLQVMNSWCRSKRQAEVVVQRNSRGHTQVFTGNPKPNLSPEEISQTARAKFLEIALAIQEAEARKAGTQNGDLATHAKQLTELVQQGRAVHLPGASNWYCHTTGGMLLNGSSTHHGVKPSTLTLGEIEQALEKAFAPTST